MAEGLRKTNPADGAVIRHFGELRIRPTAIAFPDFMNLGM